MGIQVEIDGETRLAGIIGYPVTYTLSPVIHNAAYRALGLDWAYVPLVVRPESVRSALKGVAALNFAGVNITMPHKEAALDHLDDVDPYAVSVGAVNTVVVRDGRLAGFNTDGSGFLSALAEEAGFDPAGKRAAVLGAGGAARSVVHALVGAGISEVAVFNRSGARAERLAKSAGTMARAEVLRPGVDFDAFDLVVNATSLGMVPGEEPSPGSAFHPGQVVFDLIYHPSRTALVERANRAGAVARGGLGMLVRQAAASFELFTDLPAPLDAMFAAVEDVSVGVE